MEEVGEVCTKVSFAPFNAAAAIDFSQQLSNKFTQRHFGCATKEFRRNKLVAWPFQAEGDQRFVKLLHIARAQRRKLALHENQRQATDRPALARFATRSSQQELEKLALVAEVGQELACEPQNAISILKISPDGGSYLWRNGASALPIIQIRTCSSRYSISRGFTLVLDSSEIG